MIINKMLPGEESRTLTAGFYLVKKSPFSFVQPMSILVISGDWGIFLSDTDTSTPTHDTLKHFRDMIDDGTMIVEKLGRGDSFEVSIV